MSATVGQQLRQARQAKNLTLEQVSRAMHIRAHYLEALEAGNLDAMPSLAQARGFLRAYARHLGLDPAPLIEGLKSGETAAPAPPAETTQPDPSTPEADSPEVIFAEIGQALREYRELLGITLVDVERQTHLRRHYLEALEAGNLDALPSPVQGRGMLNNYAGFLGMDPDPLLLKFADGLQMRLSSRRAATEHRIPTRPAGATAPMRRLLSGDLIFGGAVVVSLLVFVIWGAIRITSTQAQQTPSATAPAIVDVLAPSPTPSPTLSTLTPAATGESGDQNGIADNGGSVSTPTPGVVLPVASEDAVQVYIVVQQRAWMRVTVDGEIAFEGRVAPGSAYPFSGQEAVEVLTGSGSALQIFYNQQDLGPMGLFGQVVSRIYTSDGILLPTATITPTPTITNTPEATPTPEATETPTTP